MEPHEKAPNKSATGEKVRGRPFTKNDPRRGTSSGRPKKSVTWKEAEDALREAIPRLMLMSKKDLKLLLEANPTGAEMLAAKYIHEHVPHTVERFLGKTPTPLTGVDGKPLIPEAAAPILPPLDFSKMSEAQLDRLIEATAAANGRAAAPAPASAPPAADTPPAPGD